MIKVTFHSQTDNKKFDARFYNLNAACRFNELYKYAGGFTRFEMDI